MNTTKLFRAVWRVNALLILLVGMLAFGVLAFASYEIYKEKFRRRAVSEVVNVEPNVRVSSEWTLGGFERVDGTDYLMAPAYSTQSYQVSYYEKGSSSVRNYLFVNAADKTSRWLVPNNNYLFLAAEKLIQTDDAGKTNAAKWMKYELVKLDTNKDKRMTSEDHKTIAVSGVTGEGYTELIQGVDRMLGSKLRDESTLLIFHNTGENSFVSEINLPERRILITKELPKIQPQ